MACRAQRHGFNRGIRKSSPDSPDASVQTRAAAMQDHFGLFDQRLEELCRVRTARHGEPDCCQPRCDHSSQKTFADGFRGGDPQTVSSLI